MLSGDPPQPILGGPVALHSPIVPRIRGLSRPAFFPKASLNAKGRFVNLNKIRDAADPAAMSSCAAASR